MAQTIPPFPVTISNEVQSHRKIFFCGSIAAESGNHFQELAGDFFWPRQPALSTGDAPRTCPPFYYQRNQSGIQPPNHYEPNRFCSWTPISSGLETKSAPGGCRLLGPPFTEPDAGSRKFSSGRGIQRKGGLGA